MSIFSDLVDFVIERRGYQKETKAPQAVNFPGGPSVYPHHKSEDFLKAYSGWVFGLVSRRAEQMASVNIKLMQQNPQGVEETFDHAALELLLKVNDEMTATDIMELTYMHLDLVGEAFWLLDRGENANVEPTSIIPLPPNKIEIIPGKAGENRIIGGYKYKRTNERNEYEQVILKPEEVIFFKRRDPNTFWRGKGIVQAAAQTVDTDEAQEKWNFKAFEQGVTVKPVFETDANLSEDDQKALIRQLHENWSGMDNANKGVVLQGGLKLSQGAPSFNAKDMEFLKGQEWTRDKQIALFGATKAVMGITDDVNRANAEASEYVFAKYTIVPQVKKFIATLNEFYLPMFKRAEDLYFDFEPPITEDEAEKRETYKAATGGLPWMTINEIREQEGLQEIEGGDKLYIPAQMVGIEANPQETEQRGFANDRHKRVYIKSLRDKQAEQKDEEFTQHIEQMVLPMVKEQFGTLEVKEETFRQRAEKEGGFHDRMKQASERKERDMKKASQKYFDEQLKKTLTLINQNFFKTATWETKAPADKFLFEGETFNNLGIKLFVPILTELVKERGKDAMLFIGAGTTFNFESPRVTSFITNNAGRLIKDINDTTQEDLKKALNEGINKGEGVPELSGRVRNVFDKAKDSRAENIARTETIKASNYAQQEAWEQSGVVQGKEWLTAADERVCPICGPLDGTIVGLNSSYFDKGETVTGGDLRVETRENVGQPPIHPQCRCTTIPVLEPVKQIQREKPTFEAEYKDLQQKYNKDIEKLSKKVKKLLDD